MLYLYLGSDNIVEVRNLTNQATGVIDTGASVVCTLTDRSGNEVAGATWPVSLTHVSAGTYRAVLPDDLVLIDKRRYIATIVATGSGGDKKTWRDDVETRYDGAA